MNSFYVEDTNTTGSSQINGYWNQDNSTYYFSTSGGTNAAMSSWGDNNIGFTVYQPSYKRPNSFRIKKKIKGSKSSVNNTRIKTSAKVFFQWIKHSLTKQEEIKVEKQLGLIQKVLLSSVQTGQELLFELMGVKLALLSKESQIQACGFGKYVTKTHIDKAFTIFEKDNIKLENLKDYPRVIPIKYRKVVEKVLKKNIFDNLKIMYLDYSNEKDNKELKSNSQKIEEKGKDPIIFGTIEEYPEKYYHICDWIDEYCDLTLSKLLDTLPSEEELYGLREIPEITDAVAREIIDECINKKKRLKETKSSTYKNLAEEDKKATKGLLNKVKSLLK